jgi:hypothetical protein
MYGVWVVDKSYHDVGLWPMFKRMAHGMFDIALRLGTSWQMVLRSMHLVDVVPTITQ